MAGEATGWLCADSYRRYLCASRSDAALLILCDAIYSGESFGDLFMAGAYEEVVPFGISQLRPAGVRSESVKDDDGTPGNQIVDPTTERFTGQRNELNPEITASLRMGQVKSHPSGMRRELDMPAATLLHQVQIEHAGPERR